jgi:ABC-type transport system involved in cytochrome bd biosynthesis fused ATPase/permease subunit
VFTTRCARHRAPATADFSSSSSCP